MPSKNSIPILEMLHGNNPKPTWVCLTYVIGLLAATMFTWFVPLPTMVYKIITFILAVDIFGGVIANATASTHAWWKKQLPKNRAVFLLLHVIHVFIIISLYAVSGSAWLLFLLGTLMIKLLLFVR